MLPKHWAAFGDVVQNQRAPSVVLTCFPHIGGDQESVDMLN